MTKVSNLFQQPIQQLYVPLTKPLFPSVSPDLKSCMREVTESGKVISGWVCQGLRQADTVHHRGS